MTRFVFDTNVMVSALLFTEFHSGEIAYSSVGPWNGAVFRPLMGELSRVLSRDRFDRYVTREERDLFLESLIRDSDLIETTDHIRACRDPEDDWVLELAVSGNAGYIVTGDSDLLVLNPFRGVEIITPAEFLNSVSDH